MWKLEMYDLKTGVLIKSFFGISIHFVGGCLNYKSNLDVIYFSCIATRIKK